MGKMENTQVKKLKLGCGVYEEASRFYVEIECTADVDALKTAIFDLQRYRERFTFPQATYLSTTSLGA